MATHSDAWIFLTNGAFGISSGMVLQLTISGMALGAVYALVALGYTAIFRACRIINFAQGEFVMLGGMLSFLFLRGLHLPYWLSAMLAVLSTAAIGLFFQTLVIRPLQNRSVLVIIMATLGISSLISNTTMIVGGADPYSLPPLVGTETIRLFGAAIAPQSLVIIVLSIMMMLFLRFLFNNTLVGKAMEAASTEPMAARLMGISIPGVMAWAFGVSAAMGSVAGLLLTPVFFTKYDIGALLGLKGFVAAVIGGWGKNTGAVLGGILLGLAESFSILLLPSGYKDAVAFIVLFAILCTRPCGLLGEQGALDKY